MSSNRIISPPRHQLAKLRTPLTPGERRVFDFFDSNLAQEWEIYIQPHLNGLRPDIVLLNPSVGIGVYEVKDWDFDAMAYRAENRDPKPPKLVATDRTQKTFSLQTENPIEKIYRYKREIYDLYCPRLRNRSGFSAITAGVIFPFMPKDRVIELLKHSYHFRKMDQTPVYYPLVGTEALDNNDLKSVFPEANRSTSTQMDSNLAKDFRNWLVEPEFSAAQRGRLKLDAKQNQFATTRTASGYRRLKGPAGSGKSIVLAARASQLMGEGKKVLVITYNITLLHYLRDMAVRWPTNRYTLGSITWLNFHSWCKRVCEESDCTEEYKAIWRKHYEYEEQLERAMEVEDTLSLNNLLSTDLPSLVTRILDGPDGIHVERYDAILVDEGQDLLPTWWNVLRKVCKPEGEMLLVADATQDIYDSARSWTEQAMVGAGFRGGQWATLSVSYRMPPAVAEKAGRFAEQYLPKDLVDLPRSPQYELFQCKDEMDTDHPREGCTRIGCRYFRHAAFCRSRYHFYSRYYLSLPFK